MVKMKEVESFSDTEIIAKILAGEQRLFELLIRRNNPFLYKTGRSYGYGHEDTMDLMQDTFISAYLNLSKFEHRAAFKTWLIRIMLNHCFHKQRKLSYKNEQAPVTEITEKSIPMYADRQQTDPAQRVINHELSHIIEACLLLMPVEYRLVFSLREMTGLSVAETAEALHISESNVKVRFNRVKLMLRRKIEQSYSAEDIFDFNLIYCDVIVDNVMSRIASLQHR